ncbi:carboxypeptidase-like regulatory domain-containing protein [Candidatus Oscillochloris fontis]|uniref:carboxypeptidase-like regulatory domain-containing protein n=1 Tax=Candidatus Oscillochloris fontis TaxID=2496868 RepID=UPI00101D143F|nr:carboxypeptidase-like regulatory domain-containing protein [Candidatus Oscillochloris fontis]
MHRLSTRFWLLVLALFVLVPVLPVGAQQVPAYRCNNYSLDPLAPFCLEVPVTDATGAPLAGATVTVRLGDRTMTASATQTIDGTLGEAVATLPLEQLNVQPGDHLDVVVRYAGDQVHEVIGYRPDPVTRTYRTDPISLSLPLAPAPLYGRVYLLDQKQPQAVGGYTLKLFKDQPEGEPIASFISAADTQLDFTLDPGTVAHGTILWVEAIKDDLHSWVAVRWENQPVPLKIVLNWPCSGIIPHGGSGNQVPHGGSGNQVPDPFCVIGKATLDGQPMANVEVTVELLDASVTLEYPLRDTTEVREELENQAPIYVIDIGAIVRQKLPPATRLRFTARSGTLVGVQEVTLAQLRTDEDWGTRNVDIVLRQEHSYSPMPYGGQPSLVTISGSGDDLIYYVATRDGVLVRRMPGVATWMASLGNAATMRSQPELAAIVALENSLVAATLSGEVAISEDAGNTWERVTSPLGPIQALATDANGMFFLLGRNGQLQKTNWLGVDQALPAPPSGMLALAIQGGDLLAGGSTGLFVLRAGASSWQMLRSEAVRSLAVDAAGTIWVGIQTGLVATNSTGSQWLPDATLTGPISSLAASGLTLVAITAEGLVERSAPDQPWQTLALREAATPQLSLGAPTVYELRTSGPRTYAATQRGVMLSATGGVSWEPFNPDFTQDVRSLALLNNGNLLAVGPSGLFELSPTTAAPISLPNAASLNPTEVRVSNDGSVWLVGRGAGPGDALRIYDGSWSSLKVGEGRGISGIEFLPGSRGNSEAVLATLGDGLWLWQRGVGLSAFPALPTPGGQRLRSAALWVSDSEPCLIMLGTNSPATGTPAAIYTRACDLSSAWNGPYDLVHSNGTSARSVTAITRTPLGRYFAATDIGFFQSEDGATWESIFGLPIRPLALAPAANYAEERSLLTGGTQSGVIRLFDATPDLQLDLECPAIARGNTQLTCTLRATNQGLLAAEGVAINLTYTGSITLRDAPSLPLSIPSLNPGATQTFQLLFDVDRAARPGEARIDVQAPKVPQEVFAANNKDRAKVRIDYRDAPDPSLVIGGQLMSPAETSATLRILVKNRGTQPMSSAAQVDLVFPPEVLVEAALGATEVTPGLFRWTIPALAVDEEYILEATYQVPASMAEAPQVVASLQSSGDDREANNNQDSAKLLFTPETPVTIVVTNMPRLAQRGTVEEVRTALSDYLAINGGMEIALDAAAPCDEEPDGLSCSYAAWDAAVAAVTQAVQDELSEGEIIQLAEEAVAARTTLQLAIEAYIAAQIGAIDPAPSYIYLIGDDEIIPYAAIQDEKDSDPLVYPESHYAASIPLDDPFFSLFRANAYPSDRPYDDLLGKAKPLVTARQPGSPQAIAAVLAGFVTQGGTITLSKGTVSGEAKNLTGDTQREVCEILASQGLVSAASCTTIPTTVSAGMAALQQAGGLIHLSDHAARHVIGDVGVQDIAKLAQEQVAINLILMLGCHSGVSAGLSMTSTLVTEWALHSLPSFGYSNYAFAGTVDVEDSLAYSEQIQVALVQALLADEEGVTLGHALRSALLDYAGQNSLVSSHRHAKTYAGIQLFGPPDYVVRQASLNPLVQLLSTLSNLTTTTTPSLPTANSTLSLTFTHTPESNPDGTYYRVQPSSGSSLFLSDAGLPIQPGVDIALDPMVGGALLRGGSFSMISEVDPLIQSAAPVGEPFTYTERAYTGKRVDRGGFFNVYPGGDGNQHMILATGQWSPDGNVERLINSLQFELVAKAEGDPPVLGGRASICRLNQRVRVNVPDGSGVARVEVVLIEDGTFTVYPMRRVGHRWTATFAAQPWSRYIIQAVGTNGGVVVDTNNGALYIVPDEHAPCGPACDINSALDDLEVTFLADGQAQIQNYSPTCRYEVGLASYSVFGPNLVEQMLFDTDKKLLQPDSTYTLFVLLQHCTTQLDAFYGSAIADPAPPRYADRLLLSHLIPKGGYCTP